MRRKGGGPVTEIQGVVRAIIYRNEANGYTVLELADGTRMNAVQETAAVSRLGLRQGSRVYVSFPARSVSLRTD